MAICVGVVRPSLNSPKKSIVISPSQQNISSKSRIEAEQPLNCLNPTAEIFRVGHLNAIHFGNVNTPEKGHYLYSLKDEKAKLNLAESLQAATQTELYKWKIQIENDYGELGGILGGAVGFCGTILTHCLDFGALTYSGMFAGAKAGYDFGSWVNSDSLRVAEEKHAKAIATYAFHSSRVNKSEEQLKRSDQLLESARKKQAAGGEDPLTGMDWTEIKEIRNAQCQDVRDKLLNEFNPSMIAILPEYSQAYKKHVGKFENLVDLMDKMANEITSPSETLASDFQKKQEAVRSFHRLEGEYQPYGNKPHSQKFFQSLLLNEDILNVVREAILQEMAQHPVLRFPEADMKQYLESQLLKRDRSDNVKTALLNLIQVTKYSSSTLNHLLKQMLKAPSQSALVKAKINTVLEARQQDGLLYEVNPDAVANELASCVVGNPQLKDTILNVLSLYEMAMANSAHKKPALKLWLEGMPGIGKTLLVERLHKTLFGTDDGRIVVKFGTDKDFGKLMETLKKSQPLQGKTLFFDEFQEIDQLPKEHKEAALAFLKLLLSPDAQDSKKLYDNYGLDFSGTIVAFASNESQRKINALNDTQTGLSVKDRLGFTSQIQLTQNLRDYAKEIIAQFGPKQLYLKDFPELGNQITISPEAQAVLFQEAQKQLLSEPSRQVSGRSVVALVASELQKAIFRAQRETKRFYPMTMQGTFSYPFQFHAVAGRLSAAPPPEYSDNASS